MLRLQHRAVWNAFELLLIPRLAVQAHESASTVFRQLLYTLWPNTIKLTSVTFLCLFWCIVITCYSDGRCCSSHMTYKSSSEEPGSILEQLGWSKQTTSAKDDRAVQELVPILLVCLRCSELTVLYCDLSCTCELQGVRYRCAHIGVIITLTNSP